jgi:hypothetical protein
LRVPCHIIERRSKLPSCNGRLRQQGCNEHIAPLFLRRSERRSVRFPGRCQFRFFS